MYDYKNMQKSEIVYWLSSRISEKNYLSRVENFVFLWSGDSIAVDADSAASTFRANRSHICDSKGISVTSSSHEDIKIVLVFGISGKFLQRTAQMTTWDEQKYLS